VDACAEAARIVRRSRSRERNQNQRGGIPAGEFRHQIWAAVTLLWTSEVDYKRLSASRHTFSMIANRNAVVRPKSNHPLRASSAPMSCHLGSRVRVV
jgi:hypothetical protein